MSRFTVLTHLADNRNALYICKPVVAQGTGSTLSNLRCSQYKSCYILCGLWSKREENIVGSRKDAVVADTLQNIFG
jgi:hypothetical protein